MATSNMHEGFFVMARHTVSTRCNGILPSNFEAQLFSYMYCEPCSIDDVKLVAEE